MTRPLARLGVAAVRGSTLVSACSRVPWTCAGCRIQGELTRTGPCDSVRGVSIWQRHFSATMRRRDDKTEERLRRIQDENSARVKREEEEARVRAEQKAKRLRDEEDTHRREAEAQQYISEQRLQATRSTTNTTKASTSINIKSTAPATPAETLDSLPSHAESRRSELQKRASILLDELLVKASMIGQQVNQYTGTDYSGIEALRNEIIEQEQKVRQLRRAVDDARNVHHDAYAQQTSSQREIVALLERKSSWSPTDLERYMSLVRSEHLNEQSVSSAKQNLDSAEHELEEARSLLERLERKQYHEEQIWSDTIRRNSTWVTFGLMGFNIILLLANIVVFEPYRRKKIANDVKGLLDEKTVAHTAPSVEVGHQATQVYATELNSPREFDALKQAEQEQPPQAVHPTEEVQRAEARKAPLTSGEMLPLEASEVIGAVPVISDEIAQITSTRAPTTERSRAKWSTWDSYKATFHDLFSERVVQMRKVDVTNIALQGAASGFAIMGLLFVLLRPR